MSQLTVAIVTARNTDETSYHRWREVAPQVLRGQLPGGSGEWRALLGALDCFRPTPDIPDHHILHQLRALALQTRKPDCVLIIDRTLQDPSLPGDLLDATGPWPFEIRWMQPMLGEAELRLDPRAGVPQIVTTALAGVQIPPLRDRTRPWGCADKNSAIVLCDTTYLLMLDDCCIPGFSCCEAALEMAQAGKIGMLQHTKLYLPKGESKRIEVAEANNSGAALHFVLGIWCMSMKHILDVNGYHTGLDGRHADWDLELLARMRAYANAKEIEFGFDPAAKVYEIEHERPWSDIGEQVEWNENGWPFKAPGPCLRDLREVTAAQFSRIVTRADDEAEEDEEDNFEE